MLSKILGIIGHALAEKVTNRNPVTRDVLPSSMESINAAWLTDVLCRDVPGAKVTGFQLGPRDDGSTNRRSITLQYNAAGDAAGLPASLFIKAALSVSNRIAAGATGTIVTECEFFNHIRPQLKIEAPTARFAVNDPASCRAVMLLDDLVATRGAKFLDPADYIDRAHAESLVTLLATFHGQFIGRQDGGEFEVLPQWEDMITLISKIAGTSVYGHKGLVAAGELVPAKIRARSKEVWPATLRAFELGRNDPRTLTHGDVHIKNWYITRDGNMGLTDWQCLARGPLTRDLAYSISAALTVEDRRNWERELLALYLDRLQEASGQRLSFDQVFLGYRRQMLSALALWTPVLTPPFYMPAMQPAETSREYIKRITHAMDDLDTLGAVAAAA